MVAVLEEQVEQRIEEARVSKLSIADQVFVSLEYWREYRTYSHRATWRVHESTVSRIVRKVESAPLELVYLVTWKKSTWV